MTSEFRQTSIALRSDHERGRRALFALGVVVGLLILTGLWLALARVPVYAVSAHARLQARDEVHPVDTLISGRVLDVNLPLGGRVQKGDVLLTLDAADATLRLADARATERGLSAQIGALEAEITAREEALATTQSLGRARVSEGHAALSETKAEATLARRESNRTDRMLQAGIVAESEADRATSAAQQAEAAVSARDHRLTVLASEARRDLADRRAQTESLRRSLAALVAERDGAAVRVRRLEVECDRHTVRAPIDGVLGQVRIPQVGAVVAAGQTVAVVTPETEVELVADFAPADAIGRVQPGQRARMRVAAFPWTQYGMLGATVSAVSSEVMDGQIRVKLVLDDQPGSAIPRRHGLIGAVEIELDEVSPATLIARAAGQLIE
ncbi:MAG TPA: HlyD family efflux transporter periplasmic adaptor subunit [Kofleriaceae bacterium]|nr:HlyD family efflux transporter periplasmic adaptor subunit [Kofleriaceae bacterium]